MVEDEELEFLRARMGKLRRMMAETRAGGVGLIMKTDPVTVEKKYTLFQVANLMKERDASFVIVVEGSRPIGIVTEKDFVRKVIAQRMNFDVAIENIMSAPVITVDKTTDIGVATRLMIERRIRRLPVVDGDILVGVITARDVLNITPKAIEVKNYERILKDI
jgi:CBS domain-containing protein